MIRARWPVTGLGVGLVALMTPREIREVRFTSCPGWFGRPDRYDADEVDRVLDDAADTVERLSRWVLVANSRVNAVNAGRRHRRRLLRSGRRSRNSKKAIVKGEGR